MFGVFVGTIVFLVTCGISRAIYNIFFKGKIESWFGGFVFSWFVKTFLIALCLGVVTCVAIVAEPISNVEITE